MSASPSCVDRRWGPYRALWRLGPPLLTPLHRRSVPGLLDLSEPSRTRSVQFRTSVSLRAMLPLKRRTSFPVPRSWKNRAPRHDPTFTRMRHSSGTRPPSRPPVIGCDSRKRVRRGIPLCVSSTCDFSPRLQKTNKQTNKQTNDPRVQEISRVAVTSSLPDVTPRPSWSESASQRQHGDQNGVQSESCSFAVPLVNSFRSRLPACVCAQAHDCGLPRKPRPLEGARRRLLRVIKFRPQLRVRLWLSLRGREAKYLAPS